MVSDADDRLAQEFLERVRGMAGDAKATFLREACPDESLRQVVLDLSDAESDGVLWHGSPVEWLLPRFHPPSLDTEIASRYRLRERLGGGRHAAVYRAEDERLAGRSVVVKVLTDPSPWAKDKFADEAAALARVDHPGVVKILDSGSTDDGTAYLVLEYVAGQTLRLRLRDNPPELPLALRVLQRLTEAVGALHRAGVIHRDIKPENIILRSAGEHEEPVIVDLGIASLPEDGSAEHETVPAGSLGYLVSRPPVSGHAIP